MCDTVSSWCWTHHTSWRSTFLVGDIWSLLGLIFLPFLCHWFPSVVLRKFPHYPIATFSAEWRVWLASPPGHVGRRLCRQVLKAVLDTSEAGGTRETLKERELWRKDGSEREGKPENQHDCKQSLAGAPERSLASGLPNANPLLSFSLLLGSICIPKAILINTYSQ